MKTKIEKTNAMRRLDALKIKYKEHTYTDTDAVSGVEVAEVLNQEPGRVFKTLVTQGKSRNYYVFMVPVAEELDLKKAAKAVGEKSIEMIKSKELLKIYPIKWTQQEEGIKTWIMDSKRRGFLLVDDV